MMSVTDDVAFSEAEGFFLLDFFISKNAKKKKITRAVAMVPGIQ